MILHNGQALEIGQIPENQIVILLTGKLNSKWISNQANFLESLKPELDKLNISCFLVTEETGSGENFAVDPERAMLNYSDVVSRQKNVGENIVILKKIGTELKHLETKENPETDLNWIEGFVAFGQNHKLPEPDDRGYYRWGQIAQSAGEYLCIDCGYILELQAGDVFPICEVCLSGEPNGPSASEDGYWEKI